MTACCIAVLTSSAAGQTLPNAEAILDKYIEVTGGAARYATLKTQVSAGAVELSNQGLTGTITIYRASPNLVYSVIDLPIGKIEDGFDGAIAWSKSPMMRPRIKQAQERASAVDLALFNGEARWREQFASVELIGREKVGDHDCHKILLTAKSGATQTRYYDTGTNLLLKLSVVVKSPAGEFPTETLFSDYQEDGGILSAHRWIQNVMGQQIITTLKRVDYNSEVSADRFVVPAEIKALIAK